MGSNVGILTGKRGSEGTSSRMRDCGGMGKAMFH